MLFQIQTQEVQLKLNNMKQRIINTGLLIFLAAVMMAQDDAKVNALSLNWGMGNIKRQDFTITPFTHSDWSPLNVQLVYERSKKLEQQASLKFGQYSPRIDEEYTYYSFYNGDEIAEPHYFTMIDINYALGLSVVEKGKFVVGGEIKESVLFIDL
jgi:hypothetical protein